jgi:hypothetical protein
MNRINPGVVILTIITIVMSFPFSKAYSRSANRFLLPYTPLEWHAYKALPVINGISSDYAGKYYNLWLRTNPDTLVGAYIHGNFTLYLNDFSRSTISIDEYHA